MTNIHNLPTAGRRTTIPGLGQPIDGSGGGPHDPGMEQRVAKLEETVQGIDKALRELAPSIKSIADSMPKIREDLAEMKGRMTGIDGQIRQLPTMWTLTALVLSIFGLAFVLLRFAVPH